MTVLPHSVRIARCRVVRRGDSTDIKVLRKQVVTVDPEGLPCIYMARIVATLEMCDKLSSSDARGSDPLVGKSPLVVSPQNMHVAGGDGWYSKSRCGRKSAGVATGWLATFSHCPESDLQAMRNSLPVEKGWGSQVDTNRNYQISAEWQNVTKEKWQASNLATRETQGKLRDVTEQCGEIKKTV